MEEEAQTRYHQPVRSEEGAEEGVAAVHLNRWAPEQSQGEQVVRAERVEPQRVAVVVRAREQYPPRGRQGQEVPAQAEP